MLVIQRFVVVSIVVFVLTILNSCAWIRGYEYMYGHNNYVEHHIKTRGVKFYLEIYGNGEPLLMLHPSGGSIASFSNQIAYFSNYYKVITIDSRSHGASFDLMDSLSNEMMVDDFNAILDSLNLDSCNIIGWSDGGVNGLLLAIRYPEKVKKMVIVGANIWPDTSAIEPFAYNWAKKLNDSLDLRIKECQSISNRDTIEKQSMIMGLKLEKKLNIYYYMILI